MALITRRTQFKTESNPPPDYAKILKALADKSAAGTRPIKQQGELRSIIQRSSKAYDGKGKADDALRFLENECVVFHDESDTGFFYFDPERVGEVLACCVAGRRTSDLSTEAQAARLAVLIERCVERKGGKSGSKDPSTSNTDDSELEAAKESVDQSHPSIDPAQPDVAVTAGEEEARTVIHPNRLAINGAHLTRGAEQASLVIQLTESSSASTPDAFLDPRAIRRLSDEELRQRFAACAALAKYAEGCGENIDFEQQLRAEAGAEKGSVQESQPSLAPRSTLAPQAASLQSTHQTAHPS